MIEMGSKNTIAKRFRRYFGTGLLVLVPISLTAFIIYKLFLMVDGILRDVIFILLSDYLHINLAPVPGLGFLALIALITGVGFFATNLFVQKPIEMGESLLRRIPLINRVYLAIKQISNAFFGEKREVFKKAVLFEYPRKGIYSIGFFTQDTRGNVQDSLEDDVVSIFLPTTPNPTSGFLLFVPKSEIIDLDISVEEALKLVISGGAITPKQKGRPKTD